MKFFLLCKSAWQSLKKMFQEVAADPSALPGVVLSVQSYGDRLNLHPHIHAIASRGVWSADGSFEAIPSLGTQELMLLFRHQVVKNLLAAGRIRQCVVDILDRFHHPGVSADDGAARERLASYLVHAPFSLASLHYDRDAGVVTYDARASQRFCLNTSAPERFSPLDALAALTAFIPEKGLQLARYYGYYSNKARGQRRRHDAPAATHGAAPYPDAVQDDDLRRFSKRGWARLIRKVYLADPLTCSKCSGRLRILSLIDNPCVIKKILRHLKLWGLPGRSPSARCPTTLEPDVGFLNWEAETRHFDGVD